MNYILGIFAVNTFYYGNWCIDNEILLVEYLCIIINAKKEDDSEYFNAKKS